MKKMIFTLIAMLTMAINANAMSYEQARNEALFLTDKMAYELNLSDSQYEAAYEINLDYLMSVTGYDDVSGIWWERRNQDMRYILYSWQWDAFCAASYFYRPLYWEAGYWHFGIYARYPRRDYFYFGQPHFYATYRGGHSWRMNGDRSFYEHRREMFRPGQPTRDTHIGMRSGWDRGNYRNVPHGNSSTRVTVGDRRSDNRGYRDNDNRRYHDNSSRDNGYRSNDRGGYRGGSDNRSNDRGGYNGGNSSSSRGSYSGGSDNRSNDRGSYSGGSDNRGSYNGGNSSSSRDSYSGGGYNNNRSNDRGSYNGGNSSSSRGSYSGSNNSGSSSRGGFSGGNSNSSRGSYSGSNNSGSSSRGSYSGGNSSSSRGSYSGSNNSGSSSRGGFSGGNSDRGGSRR